MILKVGLIPRMGLLRQWLNFNTGKNNVFTSYKCPLSAELNIKINRYYPFVMLSRAQKNSPSVETEGHKRLLAI